MVQEVKGPGRPASPETVEALKKMTQMIRRKPGVASVELAAKLELTSLQASRLARRLESRGQIRVEKSPSGLACYPEAVAEV
jgi:DNA-binding MarR family transcriptional regulator